jgi:hypothetical protein
VLKELFCAQADVFGDLAQQWRCDVAAGMGRNGCAAAQCIPELLVGASLPNQFEAKFSEDLCDF